ncbi:DUF4019 domain-containing protein [Pseudomonas putida CSV86]|uniref:DUF4019 domain-containing protein n=1 Tax=Pseudomonas bharatica CSV86 TaxID=1005395 RepID=A0A7K4EJH1_9PSED|nr:DUF4019 domain-containing protein [Pseudomonas bharatica]NNJ17481.1 DUF4019 domain-containing protein [Pseudomonas bharatica CSV86]
MDSSILSVAGGIAGVAGLAIGALVIIFREVIRKKIFPGLNRVQAYKIIRLIICLTFLTSVSGIGAWVYTKSPTDDPLVPFPTENPQVAISSYLGFIDSGRYQVAWDSLSEEAKKQLRFPMFESTYEAERRPLGQVLTRRPSAVAPTRQLPNNLKGAFTTVTYKTRFENNLDFLEFVTTTAEHDQWKVLYHNIVPCPPLMCAP